MSKKTDNSIEGLERQGRLRTTAKHLIGLEIFSQLRSKTSVGIRPSPLPTRESVFGSDDVSEEEISELNALLQPHQMRGMSDLDSKTDVLDAVLSAAIQLLAGSLVAGEPGPGKPIESDLVKFVRAHTYLVSAARVATILELSGEKSSQANICREICRRRFRANNTAYTDEEVVENGRAEERRFQSAKCKFASLLERNPTVSDYVAANCLIISHRQEKGIADKWEPSETEMEAYPEWETIYKKHNLVKFLSKKSR